MANRICNNCGNNRDVANGTHCEKGHFICGVCDYKYTCPICSRKLFTTSVRSHEEIRQIITAKLSDLEPFLSTDFDRSHRQPAQEFFDKLVSSLDLRPEEPVRLRGMPLSRLLRNFERAGYAPHNVQKDEHAAIFDCSLDGEGGIPFFVIAIYTSTGDCGMCSMYAKPKDDLGLEAINTANEDITWVKFYNNDDGSTLARGDFLLLNTTDEAVLSFINYWSIQLLEFTRKYLG